MKFKKGDVVKVVKCLEFSTTPIRILKHGNVVSQKEEDVLNKCVRIVKAYNTPLPYHSYSVSLDDRTNYRWLLIEQELVLATPKEEKIYRQRIIEEEI